MALLEVKNIYRNEGEKTAVNGISFTQQVKEKIAIVGETGSGKTSLLKMIAGLLQPAEGEILFQQKKVTGPHEQLIPGQKGIAYLSQYFELRNNYWVYEIFEMANELSPEEAQEIYAICQVEHLLKRRTHQLSGGEKQRIALARLLTTRPNLLLLDEPFSNLDLPHKVIIKQVIQDVGAQLGISFLLVSHDPLDVLSWADTLLVLKEGMIVQKGTPVQVYYQPVNEYCAALLGEYNFLKTADASQKLFLRPEKITLTTAGGILSGTIQQILFCGTYYSIIVKAGGEYIRVNTFENFWQTGQQVGLSFERNGWLM
jgi:iron(III) transport system ATP-binding protein